MLLCCMIWTCLRVCSIESIESSIYDHPTQLRPWDVWSGVIRALAAWSRCKLQHGVPRPGSRCKTGASTAPNAENAEIEMSIV